MAKHCLSTTLRLRWAGWRPNRDEMRKLDLPASWKLFPEAEKVLKEYGGLSFGDEDERVELRPSYGEEIASFIPQLEMILARRFYPIGIIEHQDREYLLMDEQGTIYTFSISELQPYASSFSIAIDYLTQPRRDIKDRVRDLKTHGLFGRSWDIEDA